MKTALVFTTIYHRLPPSKAQDKNEREDRGPGFGIVVPLPTL